MDVLKVIAGSEQGDHPFVDLIALVEASESVGVRLALIGQDDHWRLMHGQVVLDNEPGADRTWRYPRVAFLERQMPGPLAAALMRKEPTAFEGVGPVVVAEARLQASFQRCQSWRDWLGSRVPWPHTTWVVDSVGNEPTHPRELLIGAGPNFPSFDDALSSFFYARAPRLAGGREPRWQVQRIDRAAYLDEILIGPDELSVRLAGTGVDEASVELTTPAEHAAARPDEDGRVVFPLSEGLAPRTTLVVRVGASWTDYRHFSNPDLREVDPSVTWVRPGSDIADLIDAGEGQRTEFKVKIPGQGDERRNVLKTIAAFASGSGGTVLFGVADDATIVGIHSDLVLDQEEVRITNMIESAFDPVPEVTVGHHEIDGKTVIVAQVFSDGRSYPLDPRKPVYYKRCGATTVPMRQSEVEARLQIAGGEAAGGHGF